MNGLISEDYLIHHGVKGMKWGVRHDPERIGQREVSRVNKSVNRYSKAYNKAKKYTIAYKLSDEGAKKSLSPKQYARYNSSSSRTMQRVRMKQLQKKEKKLHDKYIKQMNRSMKTLEKSDYSLGYNWVQDKYYLEKKKRSINDYVRTEI